MIRMKSDLELKKIKLNIPTYFNSGILWYKGNSCRFVIFVFFAVSENFNVGMHSDIYESIWFKLGMLIDTIELCILIIIYVTLTLMQDHRYARK